MGSIELIVILTIIIFARYLAFGFILDKLANKYLGTLVFTGKRSSNQKTKEIMNSFISSFLFGVGVTVLYKLWEYGFLYIDTESELSWWYHPISLVLALLLHETYYYWLHRIMHIPKIYRYIHRGHHDSIIVSAWSAFSFDWVETILQILAFYLIVFSIPMHIVVILILLLVMTISATINHLNIEIYPHFFKSTFPFKFLIGATHHAIHHKEFRSNYGLYFTFWDEWMKTESKNYKKYKGESV